LTIVQLTQSGRSYYFTESLGSCLATGEAPEADDVDEAKEEEEEAAAGAGDEERKWYMR
jgi:hypothetical protein